MLYWYVKKITLYFFLHPILARIALYQYENCMLDLKAILNGWYMSKKSLGEHLFAFFKASSQFASTICLSS